MGVQVKNVKLYSKVMENMCMRKYSDHRANFFYSLSNNYMGKSENI